MFNIWEMSYNLCKEQYISGIMIHEHIYQV